jgi:hypothetical protein
MPLGFNVANNMYKADDIVKLSQSNEGKRFLFLRSLSRAEHLKILAEKHGIDISHSGSRSWFEILYNSPLSSEDIKICAKEIFEIERSTRAKNEIELINELYKMREFDWGGLHQNSLEKTIIDNYVKKISIYSELNNTIENKLFQSMKGYVRCSWYNHWTSIIIEDIFKEHSNVLPAVGLVKKIDFFINDIPFDLKVTYLPEGYVKDVRKRDNLRPELTLLKQAARIRSLAIDEKLSDADLLEHLWNVIADQPDQNARDLISNLRNNRLQMLDNIRNGPIELIKWLYENQGVRRFDASNRLFLVLVNEDNFFDSWELKRNRALLAEKIGYYLNNFSENTPKNIDFVWEGKKYQTIADIILIRHKAA